MGEFIDRLEQANEAESRKAGEGKDPLSAALNDLLRQGRNAERKKQFSTPYG